jgi:hypothetical protein
MNDSDGSNAFRKLQIRCSRFCKYYNTTIIIGYEFTYCVVRNIWYGPIGRSGIWHFFRFKMTGILLYWQRFLADFLIFKKIKGGLWDHLDICLCLSVHPPVSVYASVPVRNPLNFEAFDITLLSICVSPLIFVRKHIGSPCFLCVCVYVFPLLLRYIHICGLCHIKEKQVINSSQKFLLYF